MSKERIVVTINNEQLPIRQCRKFEAGFYKIGDPLIENSGDCYLINNKYYRMETGQVVFDLETGQHTLKNENIVHGIIDFDKDGYKLGFFTINHEKNVIVNTPTRQYYAFNEEILKKNKAYRERMADGEYYHISIIDARDLSRIKKPSQEYKTSLPYDSRNVLDEFVKKYNSIELKPQNRYITDLSPVLDNLSFGLEFETIAGFIPDRFLNKVGLIPLRDGSIAGIEYVTVPLSGEKGLQAIIEQTKLLEERTMFDDSCSLHLHIGNIPRTKEFILAFFKLTCAIQDEIFELFPIYKKYNFRIKNKNYSKPFPVYYLMSQMDASITKSNLDHNFDILFTYLSGGYPMKNYGNDLKNVLEHPLDPSSQQKWNITTRYYNHNLIPLIFGNKSTIEFRIHTPTFDTNKIISFIYLNACLIKFAKRYTTEILGDPKFLISRGLKQIVHEILCESKGNNVGILIDSLLNYIDSRRQATEEQNRRGEIRGKEEQISRSKYITWNETEDNKIDNEMKANAVLKRKSNPFTTGINDSDALNRFKMSYSMPTWIDPNMVLKSTQNDTKKKGK